MNLLITALLILIFTSLGLLHIYWAFGGKWGFEKALPKNEDGELVLKPRAFDSIIVSIILLTISLYLFIKIEVIVLHLPTWLIYYGTSIIAFFFLLRAIGDFKYVGFFKTVKNTIFGDLDTKFYSPLCLIIAVLLILV